MLLLCHLQLKKIIYYFISIILELIIHYTIIEYLTLNNTEISYHLKIIKKNKLYKTGNGSKHYILA